MLIASEFVTVFFFRKPTFEEVLYFSRNSTVSSNHFYSFTQPTFYIQLVYGTTTSKLIQLCKKRAQTNASQTNLKQEKEKKPQKRSEKGNPTCIKNCQLFLLTFISRNCFCFADFLFNGFVLACFHLPFPIFPLDHCGRIIAMGSL